MHREIQNIDYRGREGWNLNLLFSRALKNPPYKHNMSIKVPPKRYQNIEINSQVTYSRRIKKGDGGSGEGGTWAMPSPHSFNYKVDLPAGLAGAIKDRIIP